MGWFKRHRKGIAKCAGVLVLALSGLAYSMHRSPVVEVINRNSQSLPKEFRVMTANIARGEGHNLIPESLFESYEGHTDGIKALEGIIQEEDIDLACIQEIENAYTHAAKNTPAIVMGDFNTVPLGGRDYIYPGDFTKKFEDEMSWYLAKSVESMYGVQIHYDARLNLFDPDKPSVMPATNLGSAKRGEFGLPYEPDLGGPQKVIDYVLLVTHPKDRIRLKLKSTEVYYGIRCSDHAPVIADIGVEE